MKSLCSLREAILYVPNRFLANDCAALDVPQSTFARRRGYPSLELNPVLSVETMMQLVVAFVLLWLHNAFCRETNAQCGYGYKCFPYRLISQLDGFEIRSYDQSTNTLLPHAARPGAQRRG